MQHTYAILVCISKKQSQGLSPLRSNYCPIWICTEVQYGDFLNFVCCGIKYNGNCGELVWNWGSCLHDYCNLNSSFIVRFSIWMFSTHMMWLQASNIPSGLTSTQYDTTPYHEYKSPEMLGQRCNLLCEERQVGRSMVTSSTTTRYTCKKERQLKN